MNGFTDIVSGFSQAAVSALVARADALYISDVPLPGTEIEGLISGRDLVTAAQNTVTLNNALQNNTPKELIIPDSSGAVDGTWYTKETVELGDDTTLHFVGTVGQYHEAYDSNNTYTMRVSGSDVTINNPLINQIHTFIDPAKSGTHACLAVFGDGSINCTINGGILDEGGWNAFQGGENNTTINNTVMIDHYEHCCYIHGGSRATPEDPDTRPIGIVLSGIIFENPENTTTAGVEGNHVQIRSYKDVHLTNCIGRGAPQGPATQMAILISGTENILIEDCEFSDFRGGAIYSNSDSAYNYDMGGTFVINRTIFTAGYDTVERWLHYGSNALDATFTDCTFNRAGSIDRTDDTFIGCTFKTNNLPMAVRRGSIATFNNCTFDASDSTASEFMQVDADASAIFTGTTTRIEPDGGQPFDWGDIPAS